MCRSPLPALFMRFVIQAVQTAPQLRSFVCDMLSTLVNKAVWTNSSQWKGWVRCVQDLVPDSLPVLLQVQILLDQNMCYGARGSRCERQIKFLPCKGLSAQEDRHTLGDCAQTVPG